MLRPLMIREPSLDAVAEAIQVPFRASSRRAAAGGISAAAVQHGRGHSVVNPRAAQVLRAEMLEEEMARRGAAAGFSCPILERSATAVAVIPLHASPFHSGFSILIKEKSP
jgi:hypothetical protein